MAGNEHVPESKLASPLGFGGISLIVIGVVMIIIGMVFLIIYQNQDKPWWVWTILLIGIAFGLFGALILVFWLSYKPNSEEFCSKIITSDSDYSLIPIIDNSDNTPQPYYSSRPPYDGSQRYYVTRSISD
jgi:energy-coupling factor transporter transmembrane protein EcfT